MKEEFYLITMIAKNGKKLYLKASDKPLKKDTTIFEWSFDKKNAIWWNTFNETEKFAKNYFKNFKKWEIEEIVVSI